VGVEDLAARLRSVLGDEAVLTDWGRIYLMDLVRQGELLTASTVQHFDACLGCLACVTACPSGVQYDRLISATRAQVERNHERPRGQRALRAAIFQLFPYPHRLRALRGPLRLHQKSGLSRLLRRSGLLRRVSPSSAAMETLAPPLSRAERVPERVHAQGTPRGTVGMLLGCVQREFFPDVNAATARVLAAEGFHVVAPASQGCCGAEFLVEVGTVATRHPLPVTVAYHDACHLSHAQRVRSQPRNLLNAIPKLQLREINDADICCGSAGLYNILNPKPARELGDIKAKNILDTGAQLLVAANPGCLMQVSSAIERLGRTMPVAHTIEILDVSIRGLSLGSLGLDQPSR
jgi:glycolate oxidase iron-sulfur subunit